MNNILLIIQNLSNGGAERAITLLANTLKDDYNVTLAIFDGNQKEYIPEVNVIDLKIRDSKSFFKKIINIFKRIKRIKKIKKQLDINYTISYLSGPNIVNVLSKNKDKTIISIRNMQSKLKKNILRDVVNQITLKKADKIITVSDEVKLDVIQHYKVDENKIKTIYNMVNLKQIYEKQKEKIEEEIFLNDGVKIINIGRLIIQKGQWHLIKAFKIIIENYPNAKLIILGRGELEEEFKNLINELNIEKNVYILGFKTNPYKYLRNSDIYISTSNYEGMSNVILEAMACGLPIIATDCPGGTKEILLDKPKIGTYIKKQQEADYGVLIPNLKRKFNNNNELEQEDIELANTIIELIQNKEKTKYYKKKSTQRIQDFSVESIKKQWKELLLN